MAKTRHASSALHVPRSEFNSPLPTPNSQLPKTMFSITNPHGSFPISYPRYWLIVNKCNKDRHLAHKLFWDARDKQNPYAYILKKINQGWHRIDTVHMDYNKATMEQWIEETIFSKKKKPRQVVTIKKESTVESIGTLLAGIINKG